LCCRTSTMSDETGLQLSSNYPQAPSLVSTLARVEGRLADYRQERNNGNFS
jgi:hypothetical protein